VQEAFNTRLRIAFYIARYEDGATAARGLQEEGKIFYRKSGRLHVLCVLFLK
jgi:hypothetical protein